jgi:steroid delta-isomerase
MNTQLAISPDQIRSTVQQYFQASQSDDPVEAMVACFAPDSVNYDPAEGAALRGHDQLRQFFRQIADRFVTIGLQAEFISINGNEAAVKWIGQGISTMGRSVKFEGIDLFEFNTAGKIQSMRAYWNPGTMLAELEQP